MPPEKWDDDDDQDSSTPPSSPPPPLVRLKKYDDEEDEDSEEVADAWDEVDSDAEREKAKRVAEATAKGEAEKKANAKSTEQRRQEHIAARRKKAAQLTRESGDDDSADEDPSARKARLLAEERERDLEHAADLIGGAGILNSSRTTPKPVAILGDPNDPANAIDLSSLPIFNPTTKYEWSKLRTTLSAVLTPKSKAAQYSIFLSDFMKSLAKEMSGEQIKKLSSSLITLSNEKMREEKAAEKGGKKSKASKSKATLNTTRDIDLPKADIASYNYNDGLGDDDFM